WSSDVCSSDLTIFSLVDIRPNFVQRRRKNKHGPDSVHALEHLVGTRDAVGLGSADHEVVMQKCHIRGNMLIPLHSPGGSGSAVTARESARTFASIKARQPRHLGA